MRIIFCFINILLSIIYMKFIEEDKNESKKQNDEMLQFLICIPPMFCFLKL